MGRISLVNYRYFVSGGPERYMFSIIRKMEEEGHTVIPFSTRNRNNVPTEYSRYFADPIGSEDTVYYREYRKTPKTILQLLARSFYSRQVEKAFALQIQKEKPDVFYILHHINKLSPSVIQAAKRSGKRVVVRLSDFFLLCPRFDFLRDGTVCEDCLKGSLLHAIRHKCVQSSLAASAVRVMAMYFHRLIGIYKKVDCFITPSAWLRRKLLEAGFEEQNVIHLPTFIESKDIVPQYEHGSHILYLGRLNREKGVEFAVRAMAHVDDGSLVLKIAGEASDGERENILQMTQDLGLKNVELLGFKSGEALHELIREAKFLLVPSIWYDNMPNVILEAFAHGKPVIASNLGSLPELVEDGVNGLLFEPGNAGDLAVKINALNSREDWIRTFGENARKRVETLYNSDLHYRKLNAILFGQGGD